MSQLKPVKLGYARKAFPANVDDLLPKWDAIPETFKDSHHPWCVFTSQVFFKGLPDNVNFEPNELTDEECHDAAEQISACLRSFQPKHEHKIAGVAYLFSLWFKSVTIPGKDGQPDVKIP